LGIPGELAELTVPDPGVPMAAFEAAIAAEHSARLVVSRPAAHVAPFVVRT
jgi:hypothetical protein